MLILNDYYLTGIATSVVLGTGLAVYHHVTAKEEGNPSRFGERLLVTTSQLTAAVACFPIYLLATPWLMWTGKKIEISVKVCFAATNVNKEKQ